MKNLIKSCLWKIGTFLGLLLLVIFLFGCSEQKQEMPSGEMLRFDIDNPENTMWRTYSIEGDSIDMFAEWQEWQPNELSQREWDAYMNDEN